MRLVLYPYKLGSRSGRRLSDRLNMHRVRPNGSYNGRRDDLIVNWGNSTIPDWYSSFQELERRGLSKMLNKPEAVGNASNKLRALRILREHGVATPDFTTNLVEAIEWNNNGARVFARHRLQGHSGDGIDVCEPFDGVPHAPLYTKSIENNGEYRVHVFNGEVINYTKKRRKRGDEPEDGQSLIRNHDNGWIYSEQNLRRLPRIERLAIDAVEALGLDFGAVDIIKDNHLDVYVLEVNTAVGMSDSRLEAYAESIISSLSDLQYYATS